MKFYQMSIDQVAQELKTDIEKGLSKAETKKRAAKYGENLIPEKKAVRPFLIFLRQFFNPLIFILLCATVTCIFIDAIKDAIVITITMIMNVIIGFIQEFRAEKTVQTLKSFEVPYCTIKRDGQTIGIKAKALVPGDIVLLSTGCRVPADIRLTSVIDFTVDESILTGESKPVRKIIQEIKEEVTTGDIKNTAFSGTNVTSGKAEGIVIQTGAESHLGKIAQLVSKTKKEVSPLKTKIEKLSWFLAAVFLSASGIIILIGLIKGMAFTNILTISIAIAVAAIPEGLIIAVTIILAVGMQRMLKRHALVRHLIAAETLGSVSVICTDKTGTLTKGHMEVVRVTDETKNIIFDTILNNDAQIDPKTKKFTGNLTEVALAEYASNLEINIEEIREKFKRIDEIPFSSDIKYMATVHQFEGEQKLIVKGAPEIIFELCSQALELEKFKKIYEEMLKDGLRVLAVAEKISTQINFEKDLGQLNFIGLIGIQDPLRPTAKATVNELKKAGIKIVLITGDHQDTALNIAQQSNILHKEGKIILGHQLDTMSDEQLRKEIYNVDIFARVEPKHKIRIVKALQSIGESVAMIGDGVNDAPALKAADIGVALGSGADVAKETSDMVLLDNNLSSIDAAVKEGRCIFDNIRKVITFLLTDCFGEIVLIALCIILGIPLPILAPQILWINLIAHGLPYLAMEPAEPENMQESPRKKTEPLLNKEMKTIIFAVGIITNLLIFYTYLMLLKTDYDFEHSKTIVFTTLAISSIFFAFPLKSFRKSIFKINFFSNSLMIWTVIISFCMQLAVIYFYPLQILFNTTPLVLFDWTIIMSLVLIKVIAIEITKFLFLCGKASKTKSSRSLKRKGH